MSFARKRRGVALCGDFPPQSKTRRVVRRLICSLLPAFKVARLFKTAFEEIFNVGNSEGGRKPAIFWRAVARRQPRHRF